MRNNMSYIRLLFVIATTCSLFKAQALVAQTHAGDVEIGVSGGQLTTSGQVFESDFLPFGAVLFTDEPGFDSEIGTFNVGDDVGFNVTQELYYWNGTQLTIALGDPALMIDFFGQPTLNVDSNTTFEDGFSFPTVAPGDNGVIHRHLDFSLPISAPDGVYGLVLQLDSPQYASSDEFLIAFNNDLSGPEFEAGVDAISQAAFAAVPEPEAWALWIVGAGMMAVGLWWKRRGSNVQSG